MNWTEMYARLATDRNDAIAWRVMEQRVRAWARPHLRGETWHTIEDVVADTCSSVAVYFDRARGDETFAGFVYGCYLNERRRTLAYLQKTRPMCVNLDETDVTVPFEDSHAGGQEHSALWQALACLPSRERSAVCLRHQEGLTSEDIAAHLGVSAGNARHLVYKGLCRLRRQLKRDVAAARITSPVTL